jgi:hypothetical protein
LEKGTCVFTGLKKFFDALAERGVARTGFVQIGSALPRRQLPDGAKDSQFAIKRICHAQTAYSLLFNAKKKQKAQKKNHPSLLAPLSGNFALLNGGAISQKNQMGLHLKRKNKP